MGLATQKEVGLAGTWVCIAHNTKGALMVHREGTSHVGRPACHLGKPVIMIQHEHRKLECSGALNQRGRGCQGSLSRDVNYRST